MLRYFLSLILLAFTSTIYGQITVELGDQEETNTQFGFNEFPCIYATGNSDVKHQMLIRAQEILDAGGEVGDILSIAFNVDDADTGEDMDEFTIRMMQTPITQLSGFFEPGLSDVTMPVDYTASDGWNVHTFSVPFEWDGIQNILIETCYEGFGTTSNSEMWRSDVGFAATQVSDGGGGPGGGSACDAFFGDFYNTRPDMRLVIAPTEIPPVADFFTSTTETCSGVVTFIDMSDNEPDTWLWDFGDNTTSDEQSPTHTYTADGIYDVTLIVTNAFGSDTIVFDELITVALGGVLPISPSCAPQTTNGTLGFGIINVEFNTISNSSNDASSGFEDFACENTTVTEGNTYNLNIIVQGPADNFVQAWIDFNNNGDLEPSESIFSEQFNGSLGIPVEIPAGAVLDAPLRMRIAADFFQLGAPSSCGPYSSGQAEDYTVIIEANTEAPIASFDFSAAFSCDGVVHFFDESENIPTAWVWDFGDSGMSFDQDPEHTYTASGVYTVSLTVINSIGNDVFTIADAITVDLDQAVTPASCEPATLDYCCNYGIVSFLFGDDIDHSSVDAEEGYQDFSCDQVAEVFENEPINFFVQHNGATPHDTKIWVDFNDDGEFTGDEEIAFVANSIGAVGNYTFNGSPLLETKLRMRVSSDVIGATLDACTGHTFGQTEDYSIIIHPALMPPIPDFVGFPLYSCDGVVEFMDLSGNTPTSWEWIFGDNTTSDEPNPTHTYLNDGTYTVTLIVSNDDGSETLTFQSYVVVDSSLPCNIETLSPGSASSSSECQGMMLDSGEFMDYLSDSDNSFTVDISGLAGTNVVQLEFLEFGFAFPDVISVFDGPDNTFPLIGTYTGFSLPNGGTITSTGPYITIEESTNGLEEQVGFVLTWDCFNVGIEELKEREVSVYPNPSNGQFRIFSTDAVWTMPFIQVHDVLGKLVYNGRSNDVGAMDLSLDLSSLSNGGYSLKLWDDDDVMITKIVIR